LNGRARANVGDQLRVSDSFLVFVAQVKNEACCYYFYGLTRCPIIGWRLTLVIISLFGFNIGFLSYASNILSRKITNNTAVTLKSEFFKLYLCILLRRRGKAYAQHKKSYKL
jgi:hypothetical protein